MVGPGMAYGGRVGGGLRISLWALAGWRRDAAAVGDWGRVGIDNGLAESYYPCGAGRSGVAGRRIALYCVGLVGVVAACSAVGCY